MEQRREEDLVGKAALAAEELYNFRDSFFPADPAERDSKIRALADAALRIIESIPEGASFRCFRLSFLAF